MTGRRFLHHAAAVLAAALLFAGGASAGPVVEITGTVNWDRSTRLPEGTLATVRLLDLGRGDAPAELGAITLQPGSEPPLRFRLFYDQALIASQGSYRLVAEMTVGTLTLMESLRATPVLTTGGTAEPEILVERISIGGNGGESPVGRNWIALSIMGEPVPASSRVTLDLGDGGTAAGSTGCNTFRASYEASPEVLDFGAFSMTRRGCPTPIRRVEKRALAAFDQVRGWRMRGRELVLTDAAGGEMMRLEEGR